MDTSRLDNLGQLKMAKITDDKILEAIEQCKRQKRKQWEQRFGPESGTPFVGCRRAELQELVQKLYSVTYSDSGFRNRLKSLTEQGAIEKFRLFKRIVYYE